MTSVLEYTTPSPDSEDSAYLTPPTTTVSVSTIKDITGVSQTVTFPDSYSGGILTWTDWEDSVDQTFHDMALDFPRLEEFEGQGPIKVSQ